MATINLAPGAQYLASIRRRRRFLFSSSALVIIVTLLAWVGTFLYSRTIENQITQAQIDLQSLETQLAAQKPDLDRITLFQGRLTALQSLLDNHVMWIPLLQEIERLLPPPIVLASISSRDDSGQVEISGSAPDIDQVAQTLASLTAMREPAQFFKDGQITAVRRTQVGGGEGQPGTVRYDFGLKLFFDTQQLRSNSVASQ